MRSLTVAVQGVVGVRGVMWVSKVGSLRGNCGGCRILSRAHMDAEEAAGI